MKESDLKRSIRDLCRLNGAKVYSFYGGLNTPNGWPDLVIVYRGQLFLVEVKRPGGKLSADQEKLKGDLAEHGVNDYVVDSVSAVNRICGFPTLLGE